MAAAAWKTFRQAKNHLGQGNIDLSSGIFKLALVKSGTTMISAATPEITWASLIGGGGVTEVLSAGGYVTSGLSLVNVSWTLSGNDMKLDATDWSLEVTADLSKVRVAVVRVSVGDRVLAYSTLSTGAAFDVSNGNKLTVQMAATGILVLS